MDVHDATLAPNDCRGNINFAKPPRAGGGGKKQGGHFPSNG